MSILETQGWVTREGEGWVCQLPLGVLRKQAIARAVLLPIAVGLLTFLMVPLDEVGVQVGALVVAVFSVGCVVWGGLGFVRAEAQSAGTRTLVDPVGRRLVHPRGEASTERVQELVLAPMSGWSSWLVLQAVVTPDGVDAGTPFAAPDTGRFGLLSRVPPARGAEVAEVARAMADALGVELRVQGGVDRPGPFGMGPGQVAMLCYLPVQGIYLLASIGVLVAAKDPWLRFHAKQSLLLLAVELLGFAGAAAVGVAVMALHFDAGIAVLGLGILVVALARFAVRIGMCFKAQRVEGPVLPGFAKVLSVPEA